MSVGTLQHNIGTVLQWWISTKAQYRLPSGYTNDQQIQHVLVHTLNSDISHRTDVSGS